MLTYWWIGLGSAVGGVARFWCSSFVTRHFGTGFPWGTIIVNVSGSLLIGFFATWLSADGRLLAADARAFLMFGICGGYTTFSSFSVETLSLLRAGEWPWAVANVLSSVGLCLLAVWLGHLSASAINR
jgi:CrcB protein